WNADLAVQPRAARARRTLDDRTRADPRLSVSFGLVAGFDVNFEHENHGWPLDSDVAACRGRLRSAGMHRIAGRPRLQRCLGAIVSCSRTCLEGDALSL